MSTGFTMSYNHVLQDAQLSLSAKGLYLLMQSFAGMPGFALTKAALYRVCGDSRYTFEKTWHELKSSGYLHHFYSIGPGGGFSHAYDLCQAPETVHAFEYTASLERPNGDLRLQPSERAVRGFTRLPNAVLRSRELPLGVKGLFGLVARLLDIPGFQLRPAGVLHYCREKARRFGTLWRKLKLAGLLKQHRYPSGEENVFTYEYDLLAEPELQTPYLTNYHADGSVSSSASIGDYLALVKARAKALLQGSKRKAQKRIRAIQANRTRKYQPSETQLAAIQTQMDYDDLVTRYPKAHVDLVRTALAELRHAPAVTVQQQPLSAEERTSLWDKVSGATLSAFLDAPSWADRLRAAQYPAAYLRSVLVGFLRRQPAQPAAADAPLDAWELEWLADFHHRKKKNS